MKKNGLIITAIIVLGLLILFTVIKNKRNPINLLKLHTGIELSKECDVKKFIDKWEKNGDGETLMIFDISEKYLANIENKCMSMGYNKLPILGNLPDNYIYNFISKNSKDGYYFLKTESIDSRNYTIVVFDKETKTLVVYYTIN